MHRREKERGRGDQSPRGNDRVKKSDEWFIMQNKVIATLELPERSAYTR
jgi:hypothetical protein